MLGFDGPAIAYRIETPRLVVRCYEPTDAAAQCAVVVRSRDHLLRAGMDWVGEEATLDVGVARMRRGRAWFDLGERFMYGVFLRDGGAFVGGMGVHPSERGAELSAWIAEEASGHGYVTEASAALTRVVLEIHGAPRVEIRCAVDNERSAAVARRLGYVYEATLRAELRWRDGALHDAMRFSLTRDELAGTAVAGYDYAAFDALGRPLRAVLDGSRVGTP